MRRKVAGGHRRPRAQQATSLAFEIPLAVPAQITDPSMAANVAPHTFAGTADAPDAADALVLHEDPSVETPSMLRPRATMSSGMPPVGKLGPLALAHRGTTERAPARSWDVGTGDFRMMG